MEASVVNLRKQPFDVYIGRGGKGQDGYFGNPFRLSSNEPRGATIDKFKDYFYDRLQKDSVFKDRVHQLKGKRLGCFCKPLPCHGDIIVEYLNRDIS